ncbi:hypothetical protein NM688_g5844 [Phlebia brevispora]|uniref:Uncharacterized protein n=1 Tax=Phlebia brevispora TaxID=194682 RepID=A0ACC1SPA3_9APHY|nr:hypothetical protein NM688_g5844 [Phlebia brevispora]
MTSAHPHKRFSLHNLRLRFKSTSSVDAPPMPVLTSNASDGENRPATKRAATEPPKSQSFLFIIAPSVLRQKFATSPSATVDLALVPEDIPKSETEAPSAMQMPVPQIAGPDSDAHMPTPEPLADQHEPLQMPSAETSVPSRLPQVQLFAVTAELSVVHQESADAQTNGQTDVGDPVSGLAAVADQVHDGKPKSATANKGDAVVDKALDTLEGKVSTISGVVTKVQQVVQPVATAFEASGAVQALKSGINSLMEDIPWLMKTLDEVGKVHPFIQVAVLAFKAAYTMEMTRRNNDKRITTLYVSMKDMIAVLVQLRDVKDPSAVGPDGRTIEARMQALSNQTAEDIKECANVCDTYAKKRLLVKVLKGQVWEAKLVTWVGTFTKRKDEFQFALSIHTASAVDSVKYTVEAMDKKIADLTSKLTEMFKEFTPQSELELARRVQEKGGLMAIKDNDAVLRELNDFATADARGFSKAGGPRAQSGHGGKISGKQGTESRTSSTFSLQDLKSELREDWDTAVSNNMQVFAGKFALQQRQLQEELSRIIHEEQNRLIDEVNKGPHDLIKDKELKALWKEMSWRRNVKARLFVMTLRDNYSDIPTRTSEAVAAALGRDPNDAQHTDEWAFQYINVSYLQPIMEAFDDDGSGYVTISEVNRLVDALPPSINWSLPHWIAYWAIGWQLSSIDYCRKIKDIFCHMFRMRKSVLPENRHWLEYYLGKVWKTGNELVMSLRAPEDPPPWLEGKFQEYVKYEEERIRKNLVDIHYDIDALDTAYIVSGPGRIEKYIYPLLYLLLKRDIEIFEVAKTKILHKDELWDSADSILWVYDAVWARYRDLKALFTQQKLDVDKQMKTFACEMFDYYHDNTELYGMSALESIEWPEFETEAPVGQWDQSVKLLNYPIQEEYPIHCEVYDSKPEPLSELDLQALMPLKAVIGEWNGFVYDDGYPKFPMTSFVAHVSSKGGQNFESSGTYVQNPMQITGTCDQDCMGIVSVRFELRCPEDYDVQYFAGHILPDGSMVGTQGWDEKTSEYPNRFILRRTPAELMCHRPSPEEFTKNKARALWKFATQAIRARVLRNMWSWTYFAERRDARKRLFNWNIRNFYYGRQLTDEEHESRRQTRRGMTIQDINFQDSILLYQIRVIPSHLGYICDSCSCQIGGGRLFCLDCQPAEGMYSKTVDFCDDELCYNATISTEQRSELQHPHIPAHDFVKIRTVMQCRDHPDMNRRAKKALNACREYFNQSGEDAEETPAQREERGPSHPEVAEEIDALKDTSNVDSTDSSTAVESNGSTGLAEASTSPIEPESAPDTSHDVEVDHPADGDATDHEHDSESVSSTSTLPETVCGVCHKQVEQPCWYCIDCHDRDINFFICDDCERDTLLRCVHCEELFKQPTWWYGSQPNDNFICTKCQAKRVKPPNIDKSRKHTYEHALVRCKEAYIYSDSDTTDARIAALEEKVGALDGKMSRIEDYLVKVETTLEALLSKLNNADLRKS